MLIKALIVILAFVVWTVLLLIISANLILYKRYKYYRTIYKELSSYKFVRLGYIVVDTEKNPDFKFFTKTRDFIVCQDGALFDSSLTAWSIYGWYWLVKYRKWFNNNIILVEYNDGV